MCSFIHHSHISFNTRYMHTRYCTGVQQSFGSLPIMLMHHMMHNIQYALIGLIGIMIWERLGNGIGCCDLNVYNVHPWAGKNGMHCTIIHQSTNPQQGVRNDRKQRPQRHQPSMGTKTNNKPSMGTKTNNNQWIQREIILCRVVTWCFRFTYSNMYENTCCNMT